MGMMKNYLLQLLALCSEEQFGQDAVEWAILSGWLPLTYHLDTDLRLIVGQPGQPATGQYDAIVEACQRVCRQRDAAEADAGLLEELNRARPLAA